MIMCCVSVSFFSYALDNKIVNEKNRHGLYWSSWFGGKCDEEWIYSEQNGHSDVHKNGIIKALKKNVVFGFSFFGFCCCGSIIK